MTNSKLDTSESRASRGPLGTEPSWLGGGIMMRLRLPALALLLVLASCSATRLDKTDDEVDTTGDDTAQVDDMSTDDTVAGVNLNGPYPYQKLSDYRFFVGELNRLEPNDGVLPFEVTAILWSDNARKDRFFVLPPGARVEFGLQENWVFPVGAIVIKNFSFPEDLRHPDGPRRVIETRLLIKESSGWTGHVYLWRDDQSDADLKIAGKTVPVSYTDKKGVPQDREYVVPNINQCANCHSRNDTLRLLGPITAQLNRNVERDGATVNQLQWLADKQFFSKDLPTISTLDRFEDPFGTGALEKRARSYLHANCAHCHREGGLAGSTGLHFVYTETNTTALGFCKRPVAAGSGTGGLDFDIVPGDPDKSIAVFRMSSTDPGVKMPELPNLLPDLDGVQLMRDWISSMTPQTCQ